MSARVYPNPTTLAQRVVNALDSADEESIDAMAEAAIEAVREWDSSQGKVLVADGMQGLVRRTNERQADWYPYCIGYGKDSFATITIVDGVANVTGQDGKIQRMNFMLADPNHHIEIAGVEDNT